MARQRKRKVRIGDFRHWVGFWSKELNVAHYSIKCLLVNPKKSDPPIDDSFADVLVDDNNETALLRVNSNRTENEYFDNCQYGLPQVALHEVLHISFNKLFSQMEAVLEGNEAAIKILEVETECLIDRLCKVIIKKYKQEVSKYHDERKKQADTEGQ